MKHTTMSAIGAALLGLLLAGCESTKLAEPATLAPVESRTGTSAAAAGGAGAGGTAGGTPQSSVTTVDLSRSGAAAGTALASLPSQRVVYFDFDSFAIKEEFKPVVDAHARVLAANKARKVVVEGHTDDRGGREYNLALGQKRAEAVARSMALLGAGEGQVEAVSFGKERPAVQGSDEAAWARNRRAELRDR